MDMRRRAETTPPSPSPSPSSPGSDSADVVDLRTAEKREMDRSEGEEGEPEARKRRPVGEPSDAAAPCPAPSSASNSAHAFELGNAEKGGESGEGEGGEPPARKRRLVGELGAVPVVQVPFSGGRACLLFVGRASAVPYLAAGTNASYNIDLDLHSRWRTLMCTRAWRVVRQPPNTCSSGKRRQQRRCARWPLSRV
jgi:hypothetical protein